MSTTYNKAISWWGNEQAFKICFDGLQSHVLVPYQFVLAGGDNTLSFLASLAQCCVNEPGQLVKEDGLPLDLSAAPSPGVCLRFTCSSDIVDAHFTWRRGPESKSPLGKPAPTRSESTYSDSRNTSSSRSGQTRFRVSLIGRDGRCILTQAERSRCTSAHVVPVSRLDVYRRLLDIHHETELYATSMGFLVRDDLHRMYDRYEWSWYCKDGIYYAHFFAVEGSELFGLHGKRIDPVLFMRCLPREYLDARLAAWHYQQSVMMRIRGTAEGF